MPPAHKQRKLNRALIQLFLLHLADKATTITEEKKTNSDVLSNACNFQLQQNATAPKLEIFN